MKAEIKGSAFLGLVLVVFSSGCADSHFNSTSTQGLPQSQSGGTQTSSDSQKHGFVSPDLTPFVDAQGTIAGNASQDTTDGDPGTPLQKILDNQIKNPDFTLSVKDNELAVLPSDILAGLHLDKIRQAIFQQINKERAAAGVKPVAYDATAEAAAGIHVVEELDAKNWLSHYSLDGDLPYMRYSRAGGYDYEAENVAAWTLGADNPTLLNDATNPCLTGSMLPPATAETIDQNTLYGASYLECTMVNEKPPDDGHRKTILDPKANFVGLSIGVGIWPDTLDGQSASMLHIFIVEEFLTRGLINVHQLPLSVQNSQTQSVNFMAQLDPAYTFANARLFFETLKPKTIAEADAVTHYSLPDTFKTLLTPPPPGMYYNFGPPTPKVPANNSAAAAAGPSPSPSPSSQPGHKVPPDYATDVVVKGDKVMIPLPLDKGPGVYTVYVVGKRKSDNARVPIGLHSIYVTP